MPAKRLISRTQQRDCKEPTKKQADIHERSVTHRLKKKDIRQYKYVNNKNKIVFVRKKVRTNRNRTEEHPKI